MNTSKFDLLAIGRAMLALQQARPALPSGAVEMACELALELLGEIYDGDTTATERQEISDALFPEWGQELRRPIDDEDDEVGVSA